jgi:hypothetical protein
MNERKDVHWMMKIVVAVVLLLSLIVPTQGGAFNSDYSPTSSYKHVNETLETSAVTHADIKLIDPTETAEMGADLPQDQLSFRVINGIDLNWSKDQLITEADIPTDLVKNEMMGTVELVYPNVTVGLYNGQIDYLIIPADTDEIMIGGVEIPMDAVSLRGFLGKPDYAGEDGDVYERDGICLKLFYAEGTGSMKLESVQIYWSAAV